MHLVPTYLQSINICYPVKHILFLQNHPQIINELWQLMSRRKAKDSPLPKKKIKYSSHTVKNKHYLFSIWVYNMANFFSILVVSQDFLPQVLSFVSVQGFNDFDPPLSTIPASTIIYQMKSEILWHCLFKL